MRTLLLRAVGFALFATSLGSAASLASAQDVIPLYQGTPPGSAAENYPEKEYFSKIWNTGVVTNVTKPTLTIFKPAPEERNGTAIVVCPGGGFMALSITSEGSIVAKYLAAKGVTPIYAAATRFKDTAVPADAPPMFVAAATDDQLGLALDSILLYEKWSAAHKSVELHMFAKGGHGFGMRKQDLPTDHWIDRFAE